MGMHDEHIWLQPCSPGERKLVTAMTGKLYLQDTRLLVHVYAAEAFPGRQILWCHSQLKG